MAVTYRIDWPQLNRMSRERAYRIMVLTVAEARLVARRNALYRRYPYSGIYRTIRPIRLANSIYGTLRTTPFGYHGRVGSNLSYASSVERGAAPHVIRPRALGLGGGLYRGGGRLIFYWEKAGGIVTFRKVNHPGQEGKRYLLKALIRVGRRRGFKVIPSP